MHCIIIITIIIIIIFIKDCSQFGEVWRVDVLFQAFHLTGTARKTAKER